MKINLEENINSKTTNKAPVENCSEPIPISQLFRASAVLPGESVDHYQEARSQLIDELGAKTPLQCYLAEKILDCFWWMRRYEEQKRYIVAVHVSELLDQRTMGLESALRGSSLLEDLLSEKPSINLEQKLSAAGLSLQTAKQKAIQRHREALMTIDRLIALQAKTLEGFQKSYEHASHRRLHLERLSLAVEILRKDVKAIDVKVA